MAKIADPQHDRGDRRAHPEPDLAEVAGVAGPGQVGADDGDDERRLDALPQAGEQAAGEEHKSNMAARSSIAIPSQWVGIEGW